MSLARGVRNYLSDLRHNGGMPSMVERDAFEVGRDLAVTPGAVVARDGVAELLQYSPTIETVYDRPVLVVPPPIGRFYFLMQEVHREDPGGLRMEKLPRRARAARRRIDARGTQDLPHRGGRDHHAELGTVDLVTAEIRRRRVLGGLINEHERTASRSPDDSETAGQRSWA
jgi:Poly-beta-hydroxybutyrate polymerase (PhaC) N-terminus